MATSAVPANPSPESPYQAILTAIIKRFVRLVGAPSALSVARKIPQLTVDDEGNVTGYNLDDPVGTLTILIDRYEVVFGEIARNLALQAAQPIASAADADILHQVGLASGLPLKILLVDDHILFREGLVSLLEAQTDMEVIGQASTVQEAVALTRTRRPNVIVMDFTLPDGTGVMATQAILAEHPATQIVFLTVNEDEHSLFEAVRAGATGYLFKNVRAAELVMTLRGVARGEAGISRVMARRILEEFSRLPSPQRLDEAEPTASLTAREREIIHELAGGATNQEIARRLVISENTVKNHVRNVLAKLHLRSRRDIASYARDHGLSPQLKAVKE